MSSFCLWDGNPGRGEGAYRRSGTLFPKRSAGSSENICRTVTCFVERYHLWICGWLRPSAVNAGVSPDSRFFFIKKEKKGIL